MNIWKNELLGIIKAVFGNAGQAQDVEIAVCIIAAIIAAILALKWIGKGLGATMADTGRVITVITTGIILALAASAATNIYIVPHITNVVLAKWLPLASCAIILLAIITPITCFLLKAKYFQALVACLLSIGVTAGIVLLAHGAFGAFNDGDKGFKKTKERTDTINDVLK